MAFVRTLFNALRIVVFIDAVLSFKLRANEFPRSLAAPVLDPVYAPLRRLLSGLTGPFDLSPLIVLGALYGLQALIERSLAKDNS